MDKKELGKRLDRLVSLKVRFSETRCASCGKPLLWRQRQAGHFLPRVVKATRWDMRNVHVQCAKCNVELDGNFAQYEAFMAMKYGPEVVKELKETYLAYKYGLLRELSYQEMVKMYNDLLDELDSEVERNSALVPNEWKKII